jgi:predicted alpha/beta-fold hydrolase
MLFRGCGSAPNTARRFYHSGETADLEFAFSSLCRRWPASPWFVVGISLGGNVLLKWLGERGDAVDERIRGAAAVSVPFDLEAGARKISRGFARIYDRSFLRSLRRKALEKLRVYPDLFDRERLAGAQTVFDFDDAVTAPVHGFAGATDYYERSSSLAFLSAIRAPTLLLSAADDPFLPADVLEQARVRSAGNPHLRIEFLTSGGHVGFVTGAWPWRARYFAEERVFRFFDAAMEQGSESRYD